MAKKNECDSCSSAACSAGQRRPGETDEQLRDRQALAARLGRIERKILVLSGKGGVGKSTVAANLAVALARGGARVGLLDIDMHGPSIPKLLGLEGQLLRGDGATLEPVAYNGNLKVMSIAFVLANPDDAVIWRGPLKMGAITQFLRDVEWGELDYLVVDSPPGTGDEPLSIAQLIAGAEGPPSPTPVVGDATGAVVVTTPQALSVADVRKCVSFCRQLHLSVLGVVENMSGFVCPHCGERTDLFGAGGGEAMAADMAVPFLGRVPLDPQVVAASDAGQPFAADPAASATARAFEQIVQQIVARAAPTPPPPSRRETP